MYYIFYYDTKLGKMLIAQDDEGITEISLITDTEEKYIEKFCNLQITLQETALIKETIKQLNEYFEGKRKDFTVTLHPKGTEFQKRVWEELKKIPYGETRSYKQIAEAVGNSKAARAVGMANHNNPIMIIVPCHRVIGADKKLVGYAGGLHIKEKLINLEKE